MTEIRNISVERIFPNPHRDMSNYPISGEKVDALVRSITNGDIGVWPRIIARQVKGGFEMAFGHHLLQAAIKAGVARIPLIVMDLDDEKMLQYMGRENGEEYGTDFMVLLNTWEAAYNFIANVSTGRNMPVDMDVARLLGWTRVVQIAKREKPHEGPTLTAEACASAFKLIQGGHLRRDEFANMSAKQARDIAQRATSLMRTVERDAKKATSRATPAEVTSWKKDIGKAAKSVARDVREGRVAARDISKEFDNRAQGKIRQSTPEGRVPPTFQKGMYKLAGEIGGMLATDDASKKLDEAIGLLKYLEFAEDKAAVDYVVGQLGPLAERARRYHTRLTAMVPATPGNVAQITKRGA